MQDQPVISPEMSALLCHHARLKRVAAQLLGDCRDLDLTAASKIACMESTAFSRYFRKATGITYTEFRRMVRLQKALFIMRSSDDSVTEVALASGFGGIGSLEHAFKAVLGTTPSAYRKQFLADLRR